MSNIISFFRLFKKGTDISLLSKSYRSALDLDAPINDVITKHHMIQFKFKKLLCQS